MRKPAKFGLMARLLVRMLAVAVLMPALLFLPAGTLHYWEAWVYLGIVFTSMTFYLIYFLENDPELLERRIRAREKQSRQKSLVVVMSGIFFITYLIPGFDHRFGWSSLPVAAVILADLVVVLGYGMIFLVLRHPMYLGTLAMMLAAPPALGSCWAILPALANIPLLAARIKDEEALLKQELKGYGAYMDRTPYRLIPGIW